MRRLLGILSVAALAFVLRPSPPPAVEVEARPVAFEVTTTTAPPPSTTTTTTTTAPPAPVVTAPPVTAPPATIPAPRLDGRPCVECLQGDGQPGGTGEANGEPMEPVESYVCWTPQGHRVEMEARYAAETDPALCSPEFEPRA